MIRYYGNSPTPEFAQDGSFVAWTILTELPGNQPTHACGDQELRLLKTEYEDPILVGPGCYPTLMRYRVDPKKKGAAIPVTPPYVINAQLELKHLRAALWNQRGQGEHWFAKSRTQSLRSADWYFLTPDGMLYQGNAADAEADPVRFVALVGKEIYHDPFRLLVKTAV